MLSLPSCVKRNAKSKLCKNQSKTLMPNISVAAFFIKCSILSQTCLTVLFNPGSLYGGNSKRNDVFCFLKRIFLNKIPDNIPQIIPRI
jgi:hypothetical protein